MQLLPVMFNNELNTSAQMIYSDLVDMGYQGAVALKEIETTEDVVKLNMSVLLCNTYFVNNKMKVKREKIMLQVAKKFQHLTMPGFQLRK